MRLNPFALMFPLLCAACLPASPKGPAPVEGVPVQVFAIDIVPNKAATLYVRNDSREELTLTGFTLVDCVNVRQPCQRATPNIRIPIGKSVEVMRVEAANTLMRYRYQYTFDVRSSRGVDAAVASGKPIVPMRSDVRVKLLSDPEKFVARVAVNDSASGRCLPQQPAFTGPGRTLLIKELPGASRAERRSLYVELDANGSPALFNDNRGDNSRPGGMEGSDTMPPRTTISIQIGQGTALLINEGGGKKPEHFMVRSGKFMTAKSLGNPQEMIARVVRECTMAPMTPK